MFKMYNTLPPNVKQQVQKYKMSHYNFLNLFYRLFHICSVFVLFMKDTDAA